MVEIKYCSECKKSMEHSDGKCDNCGKTETPKPTKSQKISVAIMLGLCVMSLYGIIELFIRIFS